MELVLFSGYARLPANTPAQKMYEELVVVAVVDMNTGVVHEADCTVATELARKFVCSLLVGYDMNRGIEPLLASAERRYQGHLRKALASCIRMIGAQYAEIQGK